MDLHVSRRFLVGFRGLMSRGRCVDLSPIEYLADLPGGLCSDLSLDLKTFSI